MELNARSAMTNQSNSIKLVNASYR